MNSGLSMETPIRVISLGAGVQSTTLALMAAHGEVTPMPDAAIFADTGWEPAAVYDHLKWLEGGVLPFPVHRVRKGNIRDDLIIAAKNNTYYGIPFFTAGGGMGRRQCSKEYKLYPIRDKAKEILNWPERKRIPAGAIEVWIGISLDEAHRMKPSSVAYMMNRWPLIEQRMSRWDCRRWLQRNGYREPARSSCIGCPYHSNAEWREMKHERPNEFADAVSVDHALRESGIAEYMHAARIPLDKVDLRSAEDHGQADLFGNECEGMCGV